MVSEDRSTMRARRLILIHLFLFCMVVTASAAEVGRDEAAAAAERWLTLVTDHQGDWAGAPAPRLISVEPLREDGRAAPSGIYLLRVGVDDHNRTKKLLLAR